MRRPLAPSTVSGALFWRGVHDGKAVVETVQDVAPILERNRALATGGDRYSASRELRRVASIPLVVVQLWRDRYGIDLLDPDHWPAVKRLLGDPEWRHLRTAGGRL